MVKTFQGALKVKIFSMVDRRGRSAVVANITSYPVLPLRG